MIKLYTDAATKGNPGPSGAGILLIKDGRQIQLKHYLGIMDNHTAEFAAVKFAFTILKEYATESETIFFFTDSKIVDQSLKTSYAKNHQLIVNEINTLQDQYQLVISQWLPEKDNLGAHNLALQGLHA